MIYAPHPAKNFTVGTLIANIKTVVEIWVLVLHDIITARELLIFLEDRDVHCRYWRISPHIHCCICFHPHHTPVRILLCKYKVVWGRDIPSNRQFRYPSIPPHMHLSRFSYSHHIQVCIQRCKNMELVPYRDMASHRLLSYFCIVQYKHLRRFFHPHHILVRIPLCKDNHRKGTGHHRLSALSRSSLNIHYRMCCRLPHKHTQESSDMHI